MSLYDKYFLAPFINCACGTKPIMYQRRKVVPLCEGRVLEVGMGSALNLPFYDPAKVEFVWGLEPSAAMRDKARANLEKSPVEVKLIDLPGEEIPLEDNSVDTVLLTYTLCTIPDWHTALRQMRRVLKPGGRLIFDRAWLCPGYRGAQVAGAHQSAVEEARRRLQPAPADSPADRRERLFRVPAGADVPALDTAAVRLQLLGRGANRLSWRPSW
jgi:Methylase involved in ubiquinone/menaquinone biosynthesis